MPLSWRFVLVNNRRQRLSTTISKLFPHGGSKRWYFSRSVWASVPPLALLSPSVNSLAPPKSRQALVHHAGAENHFFAHLYCGNDLPRPALEQKPLTWLLSLPTTPSKPLTGLPGETGKLSAKARPVKNCWIHDVIRDSARSDAPHTLRDGGHGGTTCLPGCR